MQGLHSCDVTAYPNPELHSLSPINTLCGLRRQMPLFQPLVCIQCHLDSGIHCLTLAFTLITLQLIAELGFAFAELGLYVFFRYALLSWQILLTATLVLPSAPGVASTDEELVKYMAEDSDPLARGLNPLLAVLAPCVQFAQECQFDMPSIITLMRQPSGSHVGCGWEIAFDGVHSVSGQRTPWLTPSSPKS